MKLVLQDKNKYIVRGDRGEEMMEAVRKFCVEQRVEAGIFYAIGAAREIEIAWYDVHKKKYEKKGIRQELEIISVLGNIALKDGERIIHAHGSFSDKNMRVVGGHVQRLVVGAACEIYLEKLEGRIEKGYSEEIGLNLMK